MPFFSDLIRAFKGPSGYWKPDILNFIQGNYLRGKIARIFLVYRLCLEKHLAVISAASRTPRGLAVICISWVLFLIVLVFVSILLTSWEMPLSDFDLSLTDASVAEKSLDGWMGRKLYCYPPQPCEDWRPTSEVARSYLKLEIQNEEITWNL